MPDPVAIATNPVTLNLFQGPFLPASGVWSGTVANRVGSYAARSGSVARWTLKQVQGDDNGNGIA